MKPSRSLPLGLLVAYGLAFGAASFGVATPAFDDHPGQLYRLWHTVNHGAAPWTWNAGWWTGSPELQFYPPGFFWLGAALHAAALGAVSVETVYQALLWLTYLAPGLAGFALLARLLGGGWLALPGAFVSLTLSAGLASGVEGGVHIGMLPARLGWALLPLLAVALLSARWPAAAVLLAAVVLLHPAHGPAAIALLTVVALAGPGPRRRVAALALVAVVAAALTLVWTLPLLARLEHARALAWGTLTPVTTAVQHPLLPILAALAVIAVPLARTPAERAVARWPWAVLALIGADVAVVEPLGLRWLPADRIADGAGLAIVVAAGFTIGRLGEWLAGRVSIAGVTALVVALLIALGAPARTLTVWPRATDWPTLASVTRGLRLDDLWTALRRAPEGRVLFVRSSVPLVFGSEWWRPHSHLPALTPIYTGRSIVNGTFTHPSPVAALVYRGAAGPGPITTLVERLDGQSLFGRDLTALDAPTFESYADRLGISVVVALEDDLPKLALLQDHRTFARRAAAGPFVVFERGAAVTLPEPCGHDRWRARLAGEPGTWTSARVAYYPLWRARHGDVDMPTRRGALGDLEIRLDGPAAVGELSYAPGVPELAGTALSLVALVGVAAWALAGRRRQPLRAAAPASAHS